MKLFLKLRDLFPPLFDLKTYGRIAHRHHCPRSHGTTRSWTDPIRLSTVCPFLQVRVQQTDHLKEVGYD